MKKSLLKVNLLLLILICIITGTIYLVNNTFIFDEKIISNSANDKEFYALSDSEYTLRETLSITGYAAIAGGVDYTWERDYCFLSTMPTNITSIDQWKAKYDLGYVFGKGPNEQFRDGKPTGNVPDGTFIYNKYGIGGVAEAFTNKTLYKGERIVIPTQVRACPKCGNSGSVRFWLSKKSNDGETWCKVINGPRYSASDDDKSINSGIFKKFYENYYGQSIGLMGTGTLTEKDVVFEIPETGEYTLEVRCYAVACVCGWKAGSSIWHGALTGNTVQIYSPNRYISYRYQKPDGTYYDYQRNTYKSSTEDIKFTPTISNQAQYESVSVTSTLNNSFKATKVGDGTTSSDVNNVYYTIGAVDTYLDVPLKTYAVTLNKGKGISSVSGAATYRYGEKPTISAKVATGYTWSNWTGSSTLTSNSNVITVNGTKTYTANAIANTNTAYTVKHWLQNVGAANTQNSANYTLTDTEKLTGTTDAQVTPALKSYEGFTSPTAQTITIKGDGTAVVNYYYRRNSYTVSLNKGTGISSVSGNASYEYGSSVTINATVAAGYTWLNWTGGKATTTKQYTFTMPASNVSNTANAIANTYTVKYNGNGATSGTTADSNHVYGTEKNLTTNGFERKYTVTYNHNYSGSTNTNKTSIYSFGGWSKTADGIKAYDDAQSVGNLTSTANGKVNLYAIWNPTSVTYVPTRTGYTFAGWYKEAACTNSVSGTNGVYTPAANITLYAKWTANTYTINYNGNGATGGVTASSNHVYDTAKNLTANGFERKYTVTYNHNYTGSSNTSKTATYTFNCWNTNSANTGTRYTNSESVKNLTANGTANLYAIWNSASITYVPTRAGYTFAGWYKEAACTNNVVGANGVYTPVANITLYAKWVKNTYSVKYYTGGELISREIKSYLGNGAMTVGYTFNNVDLSNAINIVLLGTPTDQIITINGTDYPCTTPIFTVPSYLKINGATIHLWGIGSLDVESEGKPDTYTIESEYVLKTANEFNLSKTGYTFVGWYDNSSFTGTAITSIPKGSTGDKSFYAKWVPNVYNVNYYSDGVLLGGKPTTYYGEGSGSAGYTFNNVDLKGATTIDFHIVPVSNIITINGTNYTCFSEIFTIPDTLKDKIVTIKSYTMGGIDVYRMLAETYTIEDTYTLKTASDFNLSKPGYTFVGWYDNSSFTGASITSIPKGNTGDKNFYAKWSTNSYTLTYNANGGSVSPANKVLAYGDQYGTLPTPTRAGYTFNGWYTSASGGSLVSATTTMNSSNTTIYAHWSLDTYNINYYSDGVLANGTIKDTYTVEDAYTLKSASDLNLNKTGYTFGGWYNNPSFTGTAITSIPKGSTGNKNFYAKWIPNTYNINYYSDGVLVNGTIKDTYTPDDTYTLRNASEFNLNKSGYTFAGWYNNSSFTGSAITSIPKGSTGDKNFYAKWTANTYTVKYNGNGATGGTTANSSHTYNIAKNLTTNGYERKYTVTYNHNYYGSVDTTRTATYSFAGWANSADGIKAYNDEQSISNLTSTANGTVNLYAIWNSASVAYVPTRTGYTFEGWYSEADCINKVSDGSYTPTANITLYAKWTANTNTAYTVKHWKQNLGAVNIQNSTNYTLADTEKLTGITDTSITPTVKNYTGFTSPTVQTITIKGDGTAELNYYYTRNFYLLSLSKGIGINTVEGNGSYEYEADVIINAEITDGYTWSNWTGNMPSTIKQYTFKMPASNVSNIANAVANTYTVKYNGNGATGGTTASSTHTYEVEKALTPNGFERKYTVTYNHNYNGSTNTSKVATYTFKNWNTNAIEDGISYEDKEIIKDLTSVSGEEVNLYAIWNEASVNYIPTRIGYTFEGWYSEADCINKVSDGSYTPAANITLYAKWIANTGTKYTVKHWKQNLGADSVENSTNYTLADTEVFTGTTDTEVIPEVETYLGFTSPEVQKLVVKADGTAELNYYYTRDSYTVILNSGIGVNSVVGAGTYEYEATVKLDATVKAGYTWKSWSGENEIETKKYTFVMPANDITYTATTTANKYTINYDGNGATAGTTASSTHMYDVEQSLTSNGYERKYTVTYNHNYSGSTNTSKTAAYSFAGWAKTADGIKAYDDKALVKNLTTVANGTINLYAIWNSASVKYVPTREGYTFAGWYKETSCTNNVSGADGIYTPAANITLYAKWVSNTYTVNYNGNGATAGTTASSTHTYDVEKALTTNGFERKYTVTYNHNYSGSTNTSKTATYGFAGWATTADGTKAYDDKALVKNLTATTGGTVNLYAVWHSASITYIPIRTGYTFAGWYKETSCTNNVSGADGIYTPAVNITLYAKWIANTYTVKYNGNGATAGTTESSTHTYDVEKALTTNGFERKYTVTYNHNYSGSTNTSKTATYSFAGWSKAADGTKAYDDKALVKNLTATTGGTVNLYAVWNSASITYVPIRTGYTFAGWYKETSCTNSVSGADGIYTPAENITLYAKWIANTGTKYTVKHWKQNLGADTVENSTNYTLVDTENLVGTTNTNVTPVVKEYSGFTSPITKSVLIKADGTAELNYYYTRNSYTVTLNRGTGISNVSGAESYEYEASVTIDTTVKVGYTWKDWTGDKANATKQYTFTMPASNVSNTANAVANTYTVNYNGNGATAGTTASSTHTYDVEKALTTNGYERKYTVTYNHNYSGSTNTSKTATYNFGGWSKTADGIKAYDDKTLVKNLTNTAGGTVNLYAIWNSTSVTYVPTRTGYTFAGWYKETSCTNSVSGADGIYTPAANITLYAKWVANTGTKYTVKHWKQNLGADSVENNTNYTLADTENLVGTTNTNVTPVVKEYSGFTSPTAKSLLIKADGTAELNYYYTRNSYTVTLNRGTGISNVSGAESYEYEASVTIDATVKAGYTWKDWTGDESSTNKNYTFTMPSKNIAITANAVANTYTVKYNGNGATAGSTADSTHTYDVEKALTTNGFERNYTVTYNHNYTETVDTTRTAIYGFAGWSTTINGTKAYGDKALVKNLTTELNGIVNLYAMWNSASVTYVPTRAGYTFAGWYKEASCTNSVSGADGIYTPVANITLYAKWIANSDTIYTVKHWKQNLGAETLENSTNYSLIESENFNGITDNKVTPEVKTYTGFTSPTAQTITIKGDGTAEVNYYYIRNSYTLTLNSGTGISSASGAGKYEYESNVVIDATVKVGYTWKDWTGDKANATKQYTFTMPASNVSNTANAVANTYTVKYDGNGATAGSTADSTHTYDVAQNLTTNGFERKYTVTYNHNYSGSTNASQTATYSFTGWANSADGIKVYDDAQIVSNLTSTANGTVNLYAIWNSTSVTYVPTRTGYTFAGWYKEASCTNSVSGADGIYTPVANITLYAKWIANTGTKYTVKHWKQNLGADFVENSTNYTLADTENLVGITDNEVTPEVKTYLGFTSPTAQTITIKGDGTAELNYYYTRNSYTVTLNSGTGISSVSGSESYEYEASVTIDATVKAGYTWKDWTGDKANATKQYTFTMPAKNIAITANAVANTYTVKYNGNGATAGSTADSGHMYDEEKALTTNEFERKYTVTYNHNYEESTNNSKVATYSFNGWSKTSNGAKDFDDNESVKNLTTELNGTVDLYAVWNSASVTYVPTREGYTFAGWYKESSCTNSVSGADGIYTPVANITLYAKWVANTYTVKYNGNGATAGTMADSSHVYDEEKTLTTNGFERKYTVTYNHNYSGSTDTSKVATYSFAGWATTANGTKVYDDKALVKNLTATTGGTVNLYAVWDSASVTYVPTREGYTFAGWYKESSCTNSVSGADGIYTPTENITLYAKWVQNTYNVKYYSDGTLLPFEKSVSYRGNASADRKVTFYDVDLKNAKSIRLDSYSVYLYINGKGYDYDSTTLTFIVPAELHGEIVTIELYSVMGLSVNVLYNDTYTIEDMYTLRSTSDFNLSKTGYTFGGWYDNLTFTGTAITSIPKGSTGDKNFYAKWIPNTYTVKYNGNGATAGTVADSSHVYDVEKALTANDFERKYTVTYDHNYEGSTNNSKVATYSFAGWAKTADGIKAYNDSQIVSNLTSTANGIVNLYAVWNSSSVTYVPTRTGYTFAGWYKESSCTNSVSGADGIYTPTANITLYAKWVANTDTEYTVKHWKQNLGADSVENSTNYTLADTENLVGITDNEVTPEVKIYTGFTSPSTQTVVIKGDGTAELNYYYTRNSYTVTLNRGTGISNVSGAESYEYEASVTIDATVKAGYTWKDWTGDESSTNKNYTFTMPAKNVVITANATANTYTVKYDGNGATAGSTADSIHTYDADKNLTSNGFERKYTVTYNHNYSGSTDTSKVATYSFAGWATTANGTKVYDDGQNISNLTEVANGIVNLYAIWSSSSVTYIPTRAGYAFVGWYTESECINKVSDGEYTPTSNITLYAKWEIDENQTKELNYIVEYYKDNKKVDADTQEVKITVQLLQPDTLPVDKTQINVVDKYIGYRLDKLEPEVIPDVIASGSTIKVYYTKRTDLSYTVNYLLKDDDEDNSNNKVLHESNNVLNQTYKDEILVSDEIIEIFGYKFDSVDKEKLVIDISKNEINIFYTIDEAQTKDLSYTVEYYINGVKQENDTVVVTEPVQVLQPDTLPMKQELIDSTKYTGYELDSSNQISDIVNNGDTVKINYTNKTFSYKVQYYFNGYIDNSLTVENKAKYLDVIDTYEDKMKEGYKFDIVENLPLTVTENENSNVIKVYYKTDQMVIKEVTYEILYYKDDVIVDRRIVTRKVQILLPNKIAVDKNLIETDRYNDANFIKTEPMEIPDFIESGEIISVYYESKISQVVVKYVDQVTGEIVDQEILEGKIGEEYSITEKDLEGYTLVESSELKGIYTEEPQEKVFYYAKNAEVTVKYLEKDTDEVLDSEEIITGYEGKEFETTKKDIKDYELVEIVGIPVGTMSAGDSEVIYYYAKKTRVIVNYIDILKDENIDSEIIEGKVGDEYEVIPKDFDRYILIDKDEEESNLLPENSTGIMTKDEIVVNYYYKQISEGVIEKHIDKANDEILENTLYEGNVGDEYTTTPKEFEGYDLDEENLPENSQGVMTEELIEVKYYYMRKTQVTVQYLDRNTNEAIAEELLIEGHEGDLYETEPKEVEEYYLVESMMPENNTGIMQKDEIVVKYYYAKKSAGVVEKHIDKNVAEEILEENFYEGFVGDEYEILSKEFEGYDLDKTNLPENSAGKMTEEVIEVCYYYERIATVKVEYIDENTDEVLDSQIIKGHEGDEYKTSPKNIKDYKLDKEKMPENAEDIMKVTNNEDGSVTSEIVVKYYYKKVSAGVLEKHIDIKTEDVLEEQFYSGSENDDYKTSAKEYEKYDLVKEKLPENAEGKMTVELIEVNYYYIRKATVRVQYVDNKTGKKISEDTIIKGHEDDEYKTTAKEIKDYTLDKNKLPENAEGIMKVERSEHFVEDVKTETVVTYYYDKVEKEEPNKPGEKPIPEEKPDNGNNKPDKNPGENNTNNNSNNESNNIIINNENNTNNRPNNNSNNVIVITTPSTDNQNTPSKNEKPKDEPTKIPLPSTGDKVPVIAISIIVIVSMVNIIQIIMSKKKKDKK